MLLVNDYATPTGGAEMLLLALRDELRRRGRAVRVFASSAVPRPHVSKAEYSAWRTRALRATLK